MKRLPTLTLHHHFCQVGSHQFVPTADTEHGKLMKVELVNQRLAEFNSNKAGTLIDYHSNKM